MIFQWYLFVILFGVYVFSRMAAQHYRVTVAGEQEVRYRWFPVLVLVTVLTYTAATRDSGFGDTSAYIGIFRSSAVGFSAIPGTILSEGKDRGFAVFSILFKTLVSKNVIVFFACIAGFCLLCVFSVYRRHSSNFFMTVFLFLASGEYVQWTHNGIRQFIAVSMIFAATELLLKKKLLQYFAVVLLAATFHASALIMIPMAFVVQGKPWNYKTILFMACVLVSVSATDTLTGAITDLMENTQYANEVNQFLKTDGTNYLRVLVFCVPPVMSLLFRRWLPQNDPLVNLSINMSIASMGTYIVSMFTSGIFIGRIPIYFSLYNYMLLPLIVQRAFEKRSQNLVFLGIMGCYMIYYYYQMHVIWGFH